LDRDLSRRFVRVRIDPGVERPNALDFPFDPTDEALTRRMDIARAVLVLMRGYAVAGAPRLGKGTAGFRDWDRLVRQCVLWLGEQRLCIDAGIGAIADPALSIVEQAGAGDPETEALRCLLKGCLDAFTGRPFTAKELLEVWRVAHDSREDSLSQLCEALDMMTKSRGADQASSLALGRVLLYRRDRVCEGLVLRSIGHDRTKSGLWRVESAVERVAA
jgi:hypothetical protein